MFIKHDIFPFRLKLSWMQKTEESSEKLVYRICELKYLLIRGKGEDLEYLSNLGDEK